MADSDNNVMASAKRRNLDLENTQHSGVMMTSTSTNMTATLQPQQPDLKMMKPPPPPAEMLEQRRRFNSASPSDKILKRSYHSSTLSSTSGGCSSPLSSIEAQILIK